MNEATLILSIVQTVVIAGSFIGLIIQLRHSNRALQDNVDFKSLEYYVKLNDIMLNNKKVKEALFPGYKQNELHLFLGLAMSFFEDLFLRKLNDEVWKPWAKWMDKEFLNNDAFKVFWKNNQEYYTDEFRKEIDQRLTKL